MVKVRDTRTVRSVRDAGVVRTVMNTSMMRGH